MCRNILCAHPLTLAENVIRIDYIITKVILPNSIMATFSFMFALWSARQKIKRSWWPASSSAHIKSVRFFHHCFISRIRYTLYGSVEQMESAWEMPDADTHTWVYRAASRGERWCARIKWQERVRAAQSFALASWGAASKTFAST
jgi:hypothetical protein